MERRLPDGLAPAGIARLVPRLQLGYPGFLLAIWAVGVLAATLAWRAWPALARVLLAYGVLSRAPVALVMLFAMHGHWGTHYDYADMPRVQELPFWAAYFALALVPQLVFWVAFTIVTGARGNARGGARAEVTVRRQTRDGGPADREQRR